MLTGSLGGFEMFSLSARPILSLTTLSLLTVFGNPAWARTSSTSAHEAQFCADMISVVFDPDTGEQLIARDLCEYENLLQSGYLPEMPMCAFSFGYVRHPETMNTQTYHNTCQLNAFLRAGYRVFLRNETAL